MKLKIFFSWQMTTDVKYNKRFILNCIEKAVKKLKNKPEFSNIEFIILEGITGEAGSPQVASLIVDERIPNCDIFIADLSVVNHISWLGREIQNLTGNKYKPFQNNNVIYEYGVAYNSLGEQKIIGVLNSAFGSPNQNPSNIPFDLAHIRFPIEYNYSKDKDKKEEVEKQLVSNLTKAIKDTAIHALQSQKEKYKPLIVWTEWEKNISTSQEFYVNEKINEVVKLTRQGISKPEESIRLLGLSGLGKTRIMLEAFRNVDDSEESVILTSRILYINYNNYSQADFQGIFTNLQNQGEDRIVIVDNCPQSLHRNLLQFTNHKKNKISLVTIDSNPEEIEQDKINGVNYIIIKKEDLTSIVNDILEKEFQVLGKDNLDKIREFSQGIPLMAVLIGESIKNGEKFIGKLDDKDLLDKLLGPRGQNERARTILKSCSVFNFFGIKDELKSQLNFIATNKDLTSLNGDNQVIINEFEETCHFFLKREIFERRGRLIGMRPFPLALSLAQEWLEPCSPERLLRVITSIADLPDFDKESLSDALSEQMKYLGYNENAVYIVEKIVGLDSPFDNTEVLNTELGSRLFRSFVEVNPVAVAQNFVRQFSNKSKDQLLAIVAGRRNIIWVLEKLCFDNRTFLESAKILFSFAVAENETWSNNATGQFLHLFKLILSGTEANLTDRLKIIDWGLNHSDKEYVGLAISAMKSGLSYGHFGRSGGAEKQGIKVLTDFYPTFQDTREYWNNILDRLFKITCQGNENSQLATGIMSDSIRSVFRAGFGELILPYLQKIAELKSDDWDEALENLKLTRKYEKTSLEKQTQLDLEEIINKLTKSDFISRFINVGADYYSNYSRVGSAEKILLLVSEFAKEFVESESEWPDYIMAITSNKYDYSYHLGNGIYSLINSSNDRVFHFIDLSVKSLKVLSKEDRNPTILGGFLSKVDKDVKLKFYQSLYGDEQLDYLLFYFLSIDIEGAENFNLLFNLIDSGKYNVDEFSAFAYSNAFSDLSFQELKEISRKFFTYGESGYAIIFDIFFNLGYNNEELKNMLSPIFKECILRLGVNRNRNRQLDQYKWTETISSILKDENEELFAISINDSIIDSIGINFSYHLDHEVQNIYSILLKRHFLAVWPKLSRALLSEEEDYLVFYELKNLLGSHIGGVGRNIGVLFDGDIESIFKWCHENEPLAPTRLAELIPIFGKNNDDYSELHPLCARLVNEFGHIESVLDNLSANMGTYSWIGSVVPLLTAKLNIFKHLATHSNLNVAQWSTRYVAYTEQQIQNEKNRDEELYR
ncbi:hypothetical protein [Pedobacter nyackensis]|uniref:Uncharacterized protein n=1 Tax=Pedobacter nyackensis TaxID=475255 RepID=A0A1W2DC72_9SPHI|nr:hypothetical protein [Pedobacter nyackensis]SMC95075.1 hypothetical protein SAMN04488101_106175 [Pedobacter nyackensis]